MKKYLIIAFSLLLFSCSNNDESSIYNNDTLVTKEKEVFFGERIDGPANVRDSINGSIKFILTDDLIVENSEQINDWCEVGVFIPLTTKQYEESALIKGTKIYDKAGSLICETVSDVELWMTNENGGDKYGFIGGYTHKTNIKNETIIENALTKYINSVGINRNLKDFIKAIEQFQLERDEGFKGFEVFFNYESWIVDPSPMMRIGLVFQKERLVAIIHSRPLQINGTSDNKLDYAFDCLTYNDIDNKDEIVSMFNLYVNSVD